jgi:hypothetical protein
MIYGNHVITITNVKVKVKVKVKFSSHVMSAHYLTSSPLLQELPLSVTTTGGLVGNPTDYKTLPWKISLSNLAVSTLSQTLSPLLAPVSLDVSVRVIIG